MRDEESAQPCANKRPNGATDTRRPTPRIAAMDSDRAAAVIARLTRIIADRERRVYASRICLERVMNFSEGLFSRRPFPQRMVLLGAVSARSHVKGLGTRA